MAKYSIYALLAAAVMALLYVTMVPVNSPSGDCTKAPQAVSQASEKDCNSADSQQRESRISWPAWLVGTKSIQFHYLDLLELLFSPAATETPSNKPSSSTTL